MDIASGTAIRLTRSSSEGVPFYYLHVDGVWRDERGSRKEWSNLAAELARAETVQVSIPGWRDRQVSEHKITDEQFIAGMKAAVLERGRDFIYEGTCRYRVGSSAIQPTREEIEELGITPGCLIGLAVYHASPEVWMGMDEGSASYSLPRLGVSFTVVDAAQEAQCLQDNGRSWGDAYDTFQAALSEEVR